MPCTKSYAFFLKIFASSSLHSFDDMLSWKIMYLFIHHYFCFFFRQNIVAADIKALIAFFERNQDVTCIEDVLHMVIRAIAQKTVLASFHEQVSFIGGYPIFVNLLQRYIILILNSVDIPFLSCTFFILCFFGQDTFISHEKKKKAGKCRLLKG